MKQKENLPRAQMMIKHHLGLHCIQSACLQVVVMVGWVREWWPGVHAVVLVVEVDRREGGGLGSGSDGGGG